MTAVTDPQTRILGREALLEQYGRPRTQRLVFTNGVFDLLHRGHVEYLYAARGLGDILVVGLNTDASVRRLKGEHRPITAQADRAFVVAGLGCVDAVTLFDEDTPEQLIANLLPDVLVKGGDYRAETVAGREAVEAHGGRVMILPFVPGRSTTGIVDSIRSTLE